MTPEIADDPNRIIIAPWPRQADLIESDATEIMFGGASEGGKSHGIRLALILWCSAIPGLQCLILRKHYNDVIENHMEGENNFKILLKKAVDKKIVKITENQIRWVKTGSLITLKQCRNEDDFEKAQGIGKHVLVWDEATQIKQRWITDIRGWVRMSNEMKATLPEFYRNRFPKIIYTCNPIGESVPYFRRTYIETRKPFAKQEVGAFIQQFIPSKVTDNPSADPVAQRKRLMSMHSATVAEALITGDWTQQAGDFYKEYKDEVHAIDPFSIPSHWFKYRTFDWGSADPFVAYWIAVSDGQQVGDFQYPRGSLIVYREWYGCNPSDPSKGIHARNEEIARGIVNRTSETTSNLTFSDNWPFADRGGSKDGERYTMADTFMDCGCPLTLGNTARVYGWKQLRSRLQGINDVPMIYIFKSCKYLRDYIPALMYHETKPEDAQESGEPTHACDAIRLACTVKPLIVDEPIKESGFDISKESPSYDQVIERLQRQRNSDTNYY